MNYKIGDILYFENYYFTDTWTGNSQSHYALVLVPETLTRFAGNVYCAVITSKEPRDNHKVPIPVNHYDCFDRDTYISVSRLDLQSLSDLSRKKGQPVGHICDEHFKECYKKLRQMLFIPRFNVNPYLRATIMREWKKGLSSMNE